MSLLQNTASKHVYFFVPDIYLEMFLETNVTEQVSGFQVTSDHFWPKAAGRHAAGVPQGRVLGPVWSKRNNLSNRVDAVI